MTVPTQPVKPPPDDPEAAARKRALERATFEASMAEQEKKVSDARKAIRDASLPPTSATALEGKITLDASIPIESEILAVDAVHAIAERIAAGLLKVFPNVTSYVVQRDEDATAAGNLDVFAAQVQQIGDAYDAIIATAKPAAPMADDAGLGIAPIAVTAAVKSIIDLVALFRTDVDIKSHELTIAQGVLVSKVASFLPPSVTMYSRNVHPLASHEDAKDVLETLSELHDRRQRARAAVRQATDALRTSLETELSTLVTQHATFEQSLTTAVAPAIPPLTGIIQAKALRAKVREGAMLLRLEIQHARGTSRTERSLWSQRLSYSGGAIVTVMVIAPDGGIRLADTLSSTSGYRELPVGFVHDSADALRRGWVFAAQTLRAWNETLSS